MIEIGRELIYKNSKDLDFIIEEQTDDYGKIWQVFSKNGILLTDTEAQNTIEEAMEFCEAIDKEEYNRKQNDY